MKILSKQKLFTLILAGCILTALLFYFIPKSFLQKNSAPPVKNATILPKQEQVDFSLPVRLKISGINVDAAIEPLGLTPAGAMDIPKGPADVAWYELGPRPGETGSAVIAGHYGTWKNGQGSVFDNLHKLRSGDKLSIEDDKGATISFVVREIRSYEPTADATDVFSSDDEKSHLNLITCEGTWNKDAKSYSKRLVVFTDKE